MIALIVIVAAAVIVVVITITLRPIIVIIFYSKHACSLVIIQSYSHICDSAFHSCGAQNLKNRPTVI